jgi:hypothetical protein
MKNKAVLAVFAATVVSSQAALYTLNNGSGSTAAGVQTSDGKVFRSGTTDGQILGVAPQNVQTSAGPGILQFGVFSTEDFSGVTTPAGLVSLFTRFGSTDTSPNASFGGASTGGNRSVFSLAQSQTIAPASGFSFDNKNIYLFGGNGSTFLNSTEFFIARADALFLAADDVGNAVTPKVITINPGNSVALFGSEIANVFTTNTDASQTAGWQMAPLIPEPSAALLGALGALGLLRRRRA